MDDSVVSASDGKGGGEDIDRAYPRPFGVQGAEGFLVRVGSVRRQDDELLYTSGLPRTYEIVEQTVEGLGMGRCTPREVRRRGGIGAIFYGGCSEHLKLGREVVSEPLDNDGIAAKREMGAMLFGRSNWNDEARIASEVRPHLAR